ncbi:hypothetical protein ACEPAF_1763 [Sanghuangporus sanghuang]
MDRLPYEILCHIFLKALPISDATQTQVHTQTEFSALSIRVPLYISQVSQSWRKVSLSLGGLWSHLSLIFEQKDSPWKRKAGIEIFYAWLSRTNGSPINFQIYVYPFGTYNQGLQCDIENVIVTFLKEQRRWKDVVLVWEGHCRSNDLPGIDAAEMPLLSSLSLTYETDNPYEDPLALINISRSSGLKKLRLRGQFALEYGGEPLYALEEISEVHFWYPYSWTVSQARNLLKISPNLKAFVIRTYTPDRDAPRLANENTRLVHGLQSLFVGYRYDSEHFMDQVTLPCLDSLHYNGSLPLDGGRSMRLLKFFERSLPALTLLEINVVGLVDESLISILRLLPTLLHLRIEDMNLSPQVFQELTVTSHSGVALVCPKLQSFYYKPWIFHDRKERWYNSFITMVKSRCEVTKTFKRSGSLLASGSTTELNTYKDGWDEALLRREHRFPFFHVFGEQFPPFPFRRE